MIKYSITIPAYKGKFLAEAIESCLAQTCVDFELIIVNDCSPEDLESIVGRYNDSRIRYYVNEKNFGAVDVVDNWNKCLSYARGEYVICMGDDDRLLPSCLEEYNTLIEKYPNLDVYHARTELINENGDFVGLQDARPEWESAYSALWHICSYHRIQFIGDYLYRTSSLRKAKGFYKLPLAVYSDNISAVRAAKERGIANTQNICFQYRVNQYTITNNSQPRILVFSIKKAYDWFLDFLSDEPVRDEDMKCRELLLKGALRRQINSVMLEVIDRDLHKNGTKAFSYWRGVYGELGIEKWEIELKLRLFRKRLYKDRIKNFFRKILRK